MNIHRSHLEQIFRAAVAAVHPQTLMPGVLALHDERLQIGEEILPLNTFRKIYVAGAGKAAGEMAVEVEKVLGELITDGIVAVKSFPSTKLKYIRLFSAGHPVPDQNSVAAAEEILKLTNTLHADDLLIFLLSGGASSLLTDLPEFCSLDEMNKLYASLVTSGATIHEINAVRKHLSQLKGGNLAKLCKGKIVNFIISDVTDNDLSVIGSGPTSADESTYGDAMHVLEKYKLTKEAPDPVIAHLENGIRNQIPETPKPNDQHLKHCTNIIIGHNRMALGAAAEEAHKLGYKTIVSNELLSGNTEERAKAFFAEITSGDNTQPSCFISGGETTLKVNGDGMGGRNQHFALACLRKLNEINNEEKQQSVSVLAAGTDGNDGPTDAAGAFADVQTLTNAHRLHLNIDEHLERFDSYHFFRAADGLFVTGPTGTNVMDIVVGIVSSTISTGPYQTSSNLPNAPGS